MEIRAKSWLWKLTWPFAHNNYTNFFGTLLHPKGDYPDKKVIAHEEIHTRQARECGGWLKFYFLYLFCFPFLYNPWRWKWEWEAYEQGSGYYRTVTRRILGSAAYGWLKWH